MRYVGLVFLGMVLWAGQAVAITIGSERSKSILLNGEVISETYNTNIRLDLEYTRITRIKYRGGLYICRDNVEGSEVRVECFDDRRVP